MIPVRRSAANEAMPARISPAGHDGDDEQSARLSADGRQGGSSFTFSRAPSGRQIV